MPSTRLSLFLTFWVSLVVLLGGCTGVAPINSPIDHVRLDEGYRLSRLLKPVDARHHDPRTLVLLAFSGGGTRAAALSYGVLEELRCTQITVRGDTHPLIDEVDLITGVSGGSFTASRPPHAADTHKTQSAATTRKQPFTPAPQRQRMNSAISYRSPGAAGLGGAK